MHEGIDSLWITSPRARTSLSYAAYIAVLGLFCVLTAMVLAVTLFRDVESMKTTMFVGVLFIALVCGLFAGTIYLWLCMLVFLLKYDKRSALSKCILFLAFVLGTSLTATLYYFFVYRELARAPT
jgi:hypothetical protein